MGTVLNRTLNAMNAVQGPGAGPRAAPGASARGRGRSPDRKACAGGLGQGQAPCPWASFPDLWIAMPRRAAAPRPADWKLAAQGLASACPLPVLPPHPPAHRPRFLPQGQERGLGSVAALLHAAARHAGEADALSRQPDEGPSPVMTDEVGERLGCHVFTSVGKPHPLPGPCSMGDAWRGVTLSPLRGHHPRHPGGAWPVPGVLGVQAPGPSPHRRRVCHRCRGEHGEAGRGVGRCCVGGPVVEGVF